MRGQASSNRLGVVRGGHRRIVSERCGAIVVESSRRRAWRSSSNRLGADAGAGIVESSRSGWIGTTTPWAATTSTVPQRTAPVPSTLQRFVRDDSPKSATENSETIRQRHGPLSSETIRQRHGPLGFRDDSPNGRAGLNPETIRRRTQPKIPRRFPKNTNRVPQNPQLPCQTTSGARGLIGDFGDCLTPRRR